MSDRKKVTAGRTIQKTAMRSELFLSLLVSLFIIISCTVAAFYEVMIDNYQKNISMDSARHLAEINDQIKIYAEEEIEKRMEDCTQCSR
ncbi:MAG: hypothetical protein Q4G60_12385 [bacterium]|nr:hypothetical protein [bacterium]